VDLAPITPNSELQPKSDTCSCNGCLYNGQCRGVTSHRASQSKCLQAGGTWCSDAGDPPASEVTVMNGGSLKHLWGVDHMTGLFCPGTEEAKAAESATEEEHRTEGKDMALVAFSKLIKLQDYCDRLQKQVVSAASALPEDRKTFLSTSFLVLRKNLVLLYSPESSAPEGKKADGKVSLTERLHLMEEQMKCRNENQLLTQPLNCVQEAVLTFYERVVAMCDEDVLIGDEIPSVATRGMTSGASSSNNNKQECSPKDALFLLDVQFPGSYLEDLTDCGAHQSTIVSSM